MRIFIRQQVLKALATIAAVVAMLLVAAASQAAPIGLGNFHLINATQPLNFTNNAVISGSLSAISVPVVFNFTTQSGLSTRAIRIRVGIMRDLLLATQDAVIL
jgi:hypothetical protein